MFRLTLCTALTAVVSACAAADYPCWRNDGSGAGPGCGAPLVERLADAKLVWESEEKGIPSSYNTLMGGAAGPVLADGRIYVNYCEPGGEALAEDYYQALLGTRTPEETVALLQRKKNLFIHTPNDIRRRCLIGADDVTLCIDATTGRTLWKTVFADAGMNPSMQGRGWPSNKKGPHCVPAVAYGKVVTIGSLGMVHCVDAKTGAKLWEYATSFHGKNLETKRKVVAAKGMAVWSDPRKSPIFAGGHFIIPDERTIAALDPATGAKVWEVQTGDSPLRWVAGGQEYIIAQNTCIDPKTGKVLWKIEGVANQMLVPVAGEGYLVFGGKSGGKDNTPVDLSAYEITPQGATKAWELPGYFTTYACVGVIMDGHLFTRATAASDPRATLTLCVELATGTLVKELKTHTDTCGSLVGADQRLFWNGKWYVADPKDFRVMESDPKAASDLPAQFHIRDSNGCYVLAPSSTPVIADGRLYLRGQRSIFCYDLRK